MSRPTYDLIETLAMMPRQYAGQVVLPEELRDTVVEELRRLYQMEEDVTGVETPAESMAAALVSKARKSIN